MTKTKAAALHLLLSILFIGAFIVFLNLFWYQHLIRVTGVIEPLKLLVLIDVIIGPLLTFLVYKQGKKTLKFDLTVIFIMQLAAFFYGAYIIYQGKPSWLVFNQNAFEVVYEKEIPQKDGVLQNSGLLSQPKLAYIPYSNQRIGVAAHNIFPFAEKFRLDDWDKIQYQTISLKEAAVIADMEEETLKAKMEGQKHMLYRLANDGLMSVLVWEDKETNRFSVMTQFN